MKSLHTETKERKSFNRDKTTVQTLFLLLCFLFTVTTYGQVPTITTTAITSYDASSATMGGYTTTVSSLIPRGVIYSLFSVNPTADPDGGGWFKEEISSNQNEFSKRIYDLEVNTKYAVRSWEGIGGDFDYGSVKTFTTPDATELRIDLGDVPWDPYDPSLPYVPASPGGNWNTIANADRNNLVENLIDYNTGEATTVDIQGNNFMMSQSASFVHHVASKWTDLAAGTDCFLGLSDNGATPLTITISNLPDDKYTVEVVSNYFSTIAGEADMKVNNQFTENNNYGTSTIDVKLGDDSFYTPISTSSENYDPYHFYNIHYGDEPFWFIWEDVATTAEGEIIITISGETFGIINAIRLVAAEEITEASSTYYMAKSAGNWSEISNWYTSETASTDPADYTTVATEAPTAENSAGIIINADVSVDADVSIDQTIVNADKTLIINSGKTLTIADGDGDDLTSNGNLDINGTLSIGTATVDANGTFDATDGNVTFSDAGNLKLGGTVTSLGTFTKSTSTVTYDGGDQDIDAIDYHILALSGSSSTKTFADGTTKVDQEISLTDDITLTGSATDAVTVQVTDPYNWNGTSGNESATESRVFYINTSGKTINIENMTIKGGDLTGDGDSGGGIRFQGTSALNLNYVNIVGSKATNGGAIFVYQGHTLNLSHCSVNGNISSGTYKSGAGIRLYDCNSCSIENSTIFNNASVNTYGGGISASFGDNIEIVNSTVFNNTATGDGSNGSGDGAGIYIQNYNCTIKNSTISGNSASQQGGGIYNNGGSLLISNSIIAGDANNDDYYYNAGTLTDNGYNVVEYSNIAANATGGFNDVTSILYNTKYNDASTSYTSWSKEDTELANQNLNLSSTLADNGGSTQTLALTEGSFAVAAISYADAGSGVWNGSPTTGGNYYDQRGTETAVGIPICIGAYSENFISTLTTTTVTTFDATSATMGGNISSDGGASVTERGVVYSITSINSNPEIGGTEVTTDTNGSGTGSFSESISGLTPITEYSVQAYATNSSGTSYGGVETFTTLEYFDGEGTELSPFQIATLTDLIYLSTHSLYWDKHFKQTADIVINADESQVDWDGDGTLEHGIGEDDSYGFSPIGNSTTKFTGSFNGQSYTIPNLFINRPSTNDIGLFGFLSGATITNTNLADVDVAGNTGVGGLAGQDEGATTISACTINSGSTTIDGVTNVGGFIGNSNTSGSISDCNFSGIVSGDNSDATNSVGGFVGAKGGTGTISECSTSGTVNGNGRNHGGFVGWMNNGEIRRSYSTMAVANTSNTQGRIGGFVGGLAYYLSTSGQIYNCYATGSVTANSTTNNSGLTYGIGGFVGSYYGAGNNKIYYSYSTGAVSATSASSYVGGFSGEDFAGGDGAIDCFWDTETSGQATSLEGETGLTTAEMKTESTFTNWNFTAGTGIWEIQSGEYFSYPYLQAITYDNPGTTPEVNPIPGLEEVPPYSGGSGTSGDPYQIATTKDLIELSNTSTDWDKYFIQTASISFNSDETAVDWDGDGSAGPTEGFSPIGNSTTKFTGSYNGQYRTITNLFINRASTDDIGLFGFLSGAAITNIILATVDYTGNIGVGGLAGQDEGATTISGCTIYGSNTILGVTNVGGFIGDSNTSGSISNCNFSGTVTANNFNGANSVGGFVGQKGGTGTISESSTSGTINGNGRNHGGFVGWMNNGEIRRCYSTMAVVNTSTTQGRIGGFVGGHAYYNGTSGQIYNCYATGSVTANSTSNTSSYGIGGFVGSYYAANNNKIENSYSTGAVSATSASSYVGGFSGEEFTGSGGAVDCFWDTDASNQSSSFEEGYGETGKTTAEMKTESTFTGAGWDFIDESTNGSDNYWGINPTDNNGYPFLAWQGYTHGTPGLWNGTTNTDWATGTNWDNGNLPGSSTDVTIPSGLTNYPTLSAAGACNNLTIESTLGSTGSLIGQGNLTVNGTVSIERHMSGNAWHLVSSPSPGQTIASFLSANTNIPSHDFSGTLRSGMMDYDEASNDWNSFFLSSGQSGNLNAGKGFSARTDADGVVSFTGGTLQSGDVNAAVTTADYRWNCVGNPYPSAIAVNTNAGATNFIDSNYDGVTTSNSNLDPNYTSVYVWEQGNDAYTIIGKGDAAFYAQVGQAFMVKANTGKTSVQFTTAMQTHQEAAAFKNATISWPEVALTIERDDQNRTTKLRFGDEMSTGLDVGYDAGVFKTGFDIYTQLVEDNGVDFGNQYLPETGIIQYEIPIGIDATEGGEIIFSLQQENLPADVIPVLNDKELQTQTAFTGEEDTYSVNIGDNTKGYGRFTLSFASTTSAENIRTNQPAFKVWISQGRIIIDGDTAPGTKVELYDLQGRKLMVRALQNTNRNTISTSGLVSGIYLVNINNRTRNYTTRVVVTQ